MSEFKPHHVKTWADGLNGGNTYRRNAIRSIKRAFSWALEYGYIDNNPIGAVRCPIAGRRDKVITPDTYAKPLANAKGVFREIWIFAWETGARPFEIQRLEARHFEVTLSRIRFPREEAKGKKKARIIDLTNTALAVVRRLVKLHPSGPIFRNGRGKHWTTLAVNCAM